MWTRCIWMQRSSPAEALRRTCLKEDTVLLLLLEGEVRFPDGASVVLPRIRAWCC